jgi:hypothetical protein
VSFERLGGQTTVMRRLATSGAVAVLVVIVAFAVDAWISVPAYSGMLWPGYAGATLLGRLGIIEAFDSSGDLSLAGIVAALVVNFSFWCAVAWCIMAVFTRIHKLSAVV